MRRKEMNTARKVTNPLNVTGVGSLGTLREIVE